MNLQSLTGRARWSPRAEFPPSRMIGSRIFACGQGIYLLTNPHFGERDPVYAVSWAESDYWAKRAWEKPFSGRLDAPLAQWSGPPSLRFLGRPKILQFASVLDFERAQPGARKATVLVAEYRITDGAFLHHAINGTDGITYFYASDKPLPEDLPVALEIMLAEHKTMGRG
jgi:hypothetical protein